MKPDTKPTYQELLKKIDELKAENNLLQAKTNQKAITTPDYKSLFDHASISIWNEDFTQVFNQIDELRKLDIPDIKTYLEENPKVLLSLLSKLKINSVNQATLKLFKAESDSAFLTNLQQTFGEGAEEVFIDIIESIWKKEKSFTAEVNYKTLDGEEFAALFSIPIPQTALEQQTVPVTIQSIQKLKEAESDKRKSLVKLKEAQKLGQIGSWEWEWETDQAVWSDEMYRIYGVDRETFDPTSENVGKLILEEDRHKMENAISQLFNGEVADSFEFKIVRPNHEVRDLMIIALQKNEGTIFGVTQDITDRKKIENTLNQAQQLAKVGNWLFYPATQKIEWSDEIFRILGFDPKEGEPDYEALVDRIHLDDQDFFNDAVDQAVRLGIPYDIEHRVSMPDGEEKVVRAICKPVLGVNDEVACLMGTSQDITSHKLLDKELIKSKEKAEEREDYLNRIINNMGDPVFVKDDQYRMVLVNDSFCKLLGVQKNKIIGKTMAEDLPAKQMEGFLKIDRQVLLDGKENLNEEIINHVNGNELTIITKKSRYIDDDHNKFIIGTIRDITQAQVIQKELANQNKKIYDLNNALNKAQRLAKVGSWSFNTANQVSEWSDEMFHIWDFELKDSAPDFDTIISKVHKKDLDLFNRSVELAVSKGVPYDIEHRIYLATGEPKVVRAICQPVLGDDGKVKSLVGTSQDITSQKQFEEAQVKYQRIKAMGEMSSSIAHDFNNSLQEMIGNIEIVKLQNDFSETTLQHLNSIGSIIDDVADRVRALQKFGDTEHINKNTTLLDFNTLIEESLAQSRTLWKDTMEREGWKITVKTALEKIPKIRCTSGELKAVIYNLIKNSVEAMPEGGNLTIKTGLKGDTVFASFTDNGIGMDEETKLKIFDPFYSTKGFELGRGLGMSGAYSIIKKYKGDILVTSSELNLGTTIEIVFPAGIEEEVKILREGKPTEEQSLRILWVDDDFIISKSSQLLVESIGHRCKTVNSGKKALEYLKNNPCDVVFTDIGMPNMNGWELAEAIRNQFEDRIKIVAVTGWDIEEKVENENNIDRFMQKPFTLKNLKKILSLYYS